MPKAPNIINVNGLVVCIDDNSAYLEDGTYLVENGRPTSALYIKFGDHSDRMKIMFHFV